MRNHVRLLSTVILCVIALTQFSCDLPLLPTSYPQPTWTTYSPTWNPGNLGPVVTDIESHLWSGNPYREADKVGWVHEGTQGIAGLLRSKYHCPGFYVLQNRAVLMPEPPTTLSAVAAFVPRSLRGKIYHTYLVQARVSWNSQPTYVFGEWVAYTNGAEARQQLGIRRRHETVDYALEMSVYAICVPMVSGSNDAQMRAFIRWQLERVVSLAGPDSLRRLRDAPDAESLRTFARSYFGAEWTRRILGV